MKKWQVVIVILAVCLCLDWVILHWSMLATTLAIFATTVGGIMWYIDWDEKILNQKQRTYELKERQRRERADSQNTINWEAFNREVRLRLDEPPTDSIH